MGNLHVTRRAWIFALTMCSVCAAIEAFAVGPYFVTDLGDLPGGQDQSIAFGINSTGQIVGQSSGTSGLTFLWTPSTPNGTSGTMVGIGGSVNSVGPGGNINDLGQVAGCATIPCFSEAGRAASLWTPSTPNASTGSRINLGNLQGGTFDSAGRGINSYGQVVGDSRTTTGLRAFLWTPTSANGTSGSMINLGDLPGGFDRSMALGINSYGQVVGVSDTIQVGRAFLWTPASPNGTTGSMVPLSQLPGGDFGSAGVAINEYGQVVGSVVTSSGQRAFLWTPTVPNGTVGSMMSLGLLPGSDNHTQAWGVNGVGQVVGASESSPGVSTRAFVWSPAASNATTGAIVDLNTQLDPTSGAGWKLITAYGINDVGQIVGRGTFDPDGPGGMAAVTRGFLLTPIPEPSSISSGLIAAVLVGIARHARARRLAVHRRAVL